MAGERGVCERPSIMSLELESALPKEKPGRGREETGVLLPEPEVAWTVEKAMGCGLEVLLLLAAAADEGTSESNVKTSKWSLLTGDGEAGRGA